MFNRLLLLVAALFLSQPAAAVGLPPGIKWIEAQTSPEVDGALDAARQARRPALLYWGAAWCPPCNQLKATLFVRQDFIALTQGLSAVHLDGDLPGAQALGERFKVVGYPTLILFAPDGQELTRLAGEADPIRIVESMQRALAGGRSVRTLVGTARAGKGLTAAEWQALAFYSWATDEAQVSEKSGLAALLGDLSTRAAPVNKEASTRLWLKAAAARADESARLDEKEAGRLAALLGDAKRARANSDVLISSAEALVRASGAPGTPARTAMAARLDAALRRLQQEADLARADRVDALTARVAIARIDVPETEARPPLPPALVSEVRDMAARMDKDVPAGYERHAVITGAGYLLRLAGLVKESDALLQANMKQSHSPYYLMSQLASNAKIDGRPREALDWHERAFAESKGPATRLQWGASYIAALFDLAPADAPRIERAVGEVLADAARDKGAFYDRSQRSLKKIAARAAAWPDGAARERVRHRFVELCAPLPAADAQRTTCTGLWPA